MTSPSGECLPLSSFAFLVFRSESEDSYTKGEKGNAKEAKDLPSAEGTCSVFLFRS